MRIVRHHSTVANAFWSMTFPVALNYHFLIIAPTNRGNAANSTGLHQLSFDTTSFVWTNDLGQFVDVNWTLKLENKKIKKQDKERERAFIKLSKWWKYELLFLPLFLLKPRPHYAVPGALLLKSFIVNITNIQKVI